MLDKLPSYNQFKRMATYCHLLIDLNFCVFFVCVSFGFVYVVINFDVVFVVLYAKQKHPGCKKVQGQAEAALQIGMCD